MKKYTTVQEFMSDLSADHKAQVELVRSYILEADPSLQEHIKWNAPSYIHNGTDRITFSVLNKENVVKIILHKGAKEKEDKTAEPVLHDESGLIQWNSNIRGMLLFHTLDEISQNKEVLQSLFSRWLAIV